MQPPGPAEKVGLVDDQQGAVLSGPGSQRLVVPLVRQDDSMLVIAGSASTQATLARRQGGLQRLQIIELDRESRLRRVDRGSDVAFPRNRDAFRPSHGEGLIDRAVVAVAETRTLACRVICRQIRSAARLASVAVKVNIQRSRPKWRVSSSPTQGRPRSAGASS